MKGKVVLAMGKVAESDKADRQAEEPPLWCGTWTLDKSCSEKYENILKDAGKDVDIWKRKGGNNLVKLWHDGRWHHANSFQGESLKIQRICKEIRWLKCYFSQITLVATCPPCCRTWVWIIWSERLQMRRRHFQRRSRRLLSGEKLRNFWSHFSFHIFFFGLWNCQSLRHMTQVRSGDLKVFKSCHFHCEKPGNGGRCAASGWHLGLQASPSCGPNERRDVFWLQVLLVIILTYIFGKTLVIRQVIP